MRIPFYTRHDHIYFHSANFCQHFVNFAQFAVGTIQRDSNCAIQNMPCAQYALLYYAMCISHFRTPQKPQDPYTHTNTHYIPKYRLPHGFTQKKNLIHFICANSPMMVVWLLLTLHLVPKCLWTTKFVWMIWTIVGSVYFFLSDVFKYFGEYLSFQWHMLQSMNVNCYKLFSFYRTANGEMQLAGDGTVNQPNVLVYSRLLHRTHDMLLNYRIEFHEVAMCETCWVYTGYEYVEQQTIFGKVSRNI